ncbi:hypothetical protein ACQP04_23725 [Pseudonocardia halophobica]|uniref:hypothetical protein n=1 Tax=Pseudonocardia halophobica TaxID=29401 RepID=UPI003D903605
MPTRVLADVLAELLGREVVLVYTRAPRVGPNPVTDTAGGILTEFDDEKLTIRRDDFGRGFHAEWTTVSHAAVLELVGRANGHEDMQTSRAAGFVR